MALTTRKIMGTMVTLAVAAGAFGIYTAWREETQQYAVFTVTFTPEPRELGIQIKGHVEGVPFADDLASRSPYSTGTWIPRGAQATLFAQQVTDGTLTCTAHLNGKLVDGPNTRDEIGSVRCYVNRRPAPEPAVR